LSVVAEPRSRIAPRQIILDTSTGDPEQTVALGSALARRGVSFLDATISGNSAQVAAGEVTVMVGGEQGAFDQCQDVFRCFARKVFHIGPCGCGAKMKLVTNLVLGLNRATLAEGLAFARATGLDPARTLEVLRDSPAYSRAIDVKGAKMIAGDFEPQARLSQHLKDVRLILDAAARAGMDLVLSRAHRELLERAEADGLGQLDNSAVIRVYEQKHQQTRPK
jgi:3-hydroxyisobutyrate dehydrogenase-like beta-hydroxyacid dehydrogenase